MRTRLIGLPGTGKTTKLLEMLDTFLQSYDPGKIIYASFSNAAVNEAISRVHKKFGIDRSQLPYFRTIHSLCLRLIKQRDIDFGSQPAEPRDFRDFIYQFIPTRPSLAELIDDLQLKVATTLYIPDEEKDNQISLYTLSEDVGLYFMSVLSYCKNTYGSTPLQSKLFSQVVEDFLQMVNIPPSYRKSYLSGLIQIEIGWNRYKEKRGLFEFADLPSTVFTRKLIPLAKVLIVDEFQDSSHLQSQLVNLWSQSMDQTIVAGDPNQAIYGFNGASPEYLEEFVHDEQILLSKSWRLPARVIEYCKQILTNKWTREMHAGREIKGNVTRVSDFAGIQWEDYSSIFILGRTRKILASARDDLQNLGIISGSQDPAVIQAYILYWYYTRSLPIFFEELVELWKIDQKTGKSLFEPEMESVIKSNTSGSRTTVGPQTLEMILNFTSIAGLTQKLRRWLTPSQWAEIYSMMQNNYDPTRSISADIELMTLHASKGMEAELVVLITAASWYEIEGRIDEHEERRLYFVAATRTKRDLVLVDLTDNEPTQYLPPVRKIALPVEENSQIR